MVRRGVWECVWSSSVVFSGGILVLWSRVGVGVGEAERQKLGQFRRLRQDERSTFACIFFFSAHQNNYGMLTLCYLDLFIILSHCHHVLDPYHLTALTLSPLKLTTASPPLCASVRLLRTPHTELDIDRLLVLSY